MKRLLLAITALALALTLTATAFALQEDIPSLSSISFRGARINEEFSPDVKDYTLTLDDTAKTPTLESYELSGSAELFVTYELDGARHQSGILVTLNFDGGSAQYSFKYANAAYDGTSSNNLLADIKCNLCEVYPEVNDTLTSYKLYIPKDMTELNIRAVTKDVNAVCEFPKSIILSADQEPELTLTVTAANGATRAYTLQVKRLDKTAEEIAGELREKGDGSIVKEALFYNKPVFLISFIAGAGGIIFIAVLLTFLKRVTVRAEDADETEFFD